MKLDDPAYNVLALRLDNATDDAIASRLAATYDKEIAQTVL